MVRSMFLKVLPLGCIELVSCSSILFGPMDLGPPTEIARKRASSEPGLDAISQDMIRTNAPQNRCLPHVRGLLPIFFHLENNHQPDNSRLRSRRLQQAPKCRGLNIGTQVGMEMVTARIWQSVGETTFRAPVKPMPGSAAVATVPRQYIGCLAT
jgi:hypothetical protein